IASKPRGCDLVRMKVVDVMASGQIKERGSVLQSKTEKPVRFEISEGTRTSVTKSMEDPMMAGSEYLWPGRFHEWLHTSTRQYARIVRAVQLLLQHTKMDNTAQYLGVELEDALAISEAIEI
ncbi:integrase, partial [Loktanella salsilacus]